GEVGHLLEGGGLALVDPAVDLAGAEGLLSELAGDEGGQLGERHAEEVDGGHASPTAVCGAELQGQRSRRSEPATTSTVWPRPLKMSAGDWPVTRIARSLGKPTMNWRCFHGVPSTA